MAKGNYEQTKKTFLRVAEGEFRESYNVTSETKGAKKVSVTNPND